MNEWYLPAFCGLAVSGATDWVSIPVNASNDLSTYPFYPNLLLSSHFMLQLDGFLARKMGINSVFGSYLDPLADKVDFFFCFTGS